MPAVTRIAAAAVLLLLATPIGVAAQQRTVKVPRIGYVSTNLAQNTHLTAALRQGLRDRGYVEGRNVVIEYRSAEGKLERFPALMAELVALKVDLIVAANTRAALAAKQVTSTVPIVMGVSTDPVGAGLVASLARPGGNVTGLSALTSDLVGKCLDQLKQAVPGVRQVAVLFHRDYGERTQQELLNEADVAARALGVRLQFVEARGGPESFDKAFSEMVASRAEAVTVLTSVLFASERRRLVDLAAKHRLPAVYFVRAFVDDGGLMSYGADFPDMFRRAATYVDKILKGAKPGDLPVEQPTKFELVINLRTARALGLTIPASLMVRADQIIE